MSTAGEAEEEEEKENGAEKEADEHPVKRPAEEEVGLSFNPHMVTNPHVSSTSNHCFSAFSGGSGNKETEDRGERRLHRG